MILERVGARMWIARIMITWGIISSAFMFTGDIHWGSVATLFNCTDAEFTFYFLRFLLGVAEAGFFPGIILYLTYWFPGPRRAKMVALFMTAIAVSNVIGSPISGAIMQYMDGAERLARLAVAVPARRHSLGDHRLPRFRAAAERPEECAKWLTPQEQDMVLQRIEEGRCAKSRTRQKHHFLDAFKDGRVWALALVYFCGVVCFYAVNFWMPTIVQELGIDKTDYLQGRTCSA